MRATRTFYLVACALFAALSAVFSQISIPIGVVPINITHLSIFLSAGLLGARLGTVSQAVFVLLGAVGLPVFSGFRGGLGAVLGPTGGFIAGYIACALITGLLIGRLGRSLPALAGAMAAGLVATYVPGILWFMFVTKMGWMESLSICVFPFLIGDALKILLSAFLVSRLHPVLQKNKLLKRL